MLPFYPFYWSDYSGDTFSLSQGQHGAYFLLLRHIYTEGTPIPDKEKNSIAKAMLLQDQENVDYVLQKYFKKKGEFWYHDRAFQVIKEANESHKRRVSAGKRGGRPKKAIKKHCFRNAKAMPKQPEPEPYVLSKDNTYSEFSFDAFWRIYPKQRIGNKQKAQSAYKSALKRATEQEIHYGLSLYIKSEEVLSGFAKGATAWLNDDRWKTDYTTKGKANGSITQKTDRAKEAIMHGFRDVNFEE